MNAQHTPGPWSWSFESIDQEWAIVMSKGGNIVANVNLDTRQEANARLIAAAPDMLAALKAFAAWDQCWPGNINLEGVCEVARAAIAKAEASE